MTLLPYIHTFLSHIRTFLSLPLLLAMKLTLPYLDISPRELSPLNNFIFCREEKIEFSQRAPEEPRLTLGCAKQSPISLSRCVFRCELSFMKL